MLSYCCSKGGSNLRAFFYVRPPLVIFIINLAIFGASLLFLSYWIQYNDMQNPDATKDWNRFLERFASMEICLTGNKSYPFIRRLSAFTIDGDNAIDLPQPMAHSSSRLTVHRMQLGVDWDARQRHVLSNYSVLVGAISGRILGLRDRSTAYQVINITAVIPQSPQQRDKICVEMVGPESIFPRTRAPRECSSASFDHTRRLLSGADDSAAKGVRMSYMYIFKTVYWSSLFFCSSGQPRLKLKYTHNPALTEMLSTEEKYVAEENLSHTAYAISVLIAGFLLYAASFGSGGRCLNSASSGGGGGALYRSISLTADTELSSDSTIRARNSLSISGDATCDSVFISQQHQQQHLQQQQQHMLMESIEGKKLALSH